MIEKYGMKHMKTGKNRFDIEWRVSHEASFWNTCLLHVIAFSYFG